MITVFDIWKKSLSNKSKLKFLFRSIGVWGIYSLELITIGKEYMSLTRREIWPPCAFFYFFDQPGIRLPQPRRWNVDFISFDLNSAMSQVSLGWYFTALALQYNYFHVCCCYRKPQSSPGSLFSPVSLVQSLPTSPPLLVNFGPSIKKQWGYDIYPSWCDISLLIVHLLQSSPDNPHL